MTGVRAWSRGGVCAVVDRLAAWTGCAERRTFLLLAGAYALFAAVELLLIFTQDSAFGQDYRYHMDLTLRVLEQPGSLFWFDKTNPSLLYIIGVAMWALFGDPGFVYASAVLFVFWSVWGLHLMFLVGRRLTDSEMTAALFTVFACFLPLTMITAMVYAADTLMTVPFFGFVYAMIRLTGCDDRRSRVRWLALAGLAAFVGALAKFTFMAMLAIGPATLAALALYRRLRRSDLVPYALLVLLIPGALIVVERMENSRYVLHGNSFPHLSGAMTLRNLLLPKGADLYLLTAPSPGEPILIDGKQAMVDPDGRPVAEGGQPGYRLLVNNRHSFPGLFHLGIYTDIMDLADHGLLDGWGWGKRSALTQAFQVASVNLGLVFSLLTVAGVAAALVRAAAGAARAAWGDIRDDRELPRLLLLGVALGLFLPVLAMLPFMTLPYSMGYWLPRLVFPSVLAFGLLGFVEAGRFIDRLTWENPARARLLGRLLVGAVALQAFFGLGVMLAPGLS